MTQPENGELQTFVDTVVWLPSGLIKVCMNEASGFFTLETGGVFMGWWADSTTSVITAIIGPGPEAIHKQHSFEPDQAWQLDQIAIHYKASGGRETYLGDWHSHPNATCGGLSRTDRCVLRHIIKAPLARCEEPLMAVFYGEPKMWKTNVWHAKLRPRPLLWDKLILKLVKIK